MSDEHRPRFSAQESSRLQRKNAPLQTGIKSMHDVVAGNKYAKFKNAVKILLEKKILKHCFQSHTTLKKLCTSN